MHSATFPLPLQRGRLTGRTLLWHRTRCPPNSSGALGSRSYTAPAPRSVLVFRIAASASFFAGLLASDKALSTNRLPIPSRGRTLKELCGVAVCPASSLCGRNLSLSAGSTALSSCGSMRVPVVKGRPECGRSHGSSRLSRIHGRDQRTPKQRHRKVLIGLGDELAFVVVHRIARGVRVALATNGPRIVVFLDVSRIACTPATAPAHRFLVGPENALFVSSARRRGIPISRIGWPLGVVALCLCKLHSASQVHGCPRRSCTSSAFTHSCV